MAVRASAAPARAPRPRAPRPDEAPRRRQPAPERRPRSQSRSRSQHRRRTRTLPRVRGGWLWLPIVTLALGGIVWINVARLQLTRQTSDVITRAAVIDAQNARLADQLERQSAAIENLASARLGMTRATDGQISFLQVPKIPER